MPVPITKRRLKDRGFNQSLAIAANLSKMTDIPLSYELILKTKDTGHQALRPRQERLTALKGAFYATKDLTDMSIILVDDVMTTGSTLNECSLELIKANAKTVVCVVIARAS
ncbi:amidophosphoribosyltransferase [Candidatus Magnetoovum chiemensis]|nr:amidophosphoribosyltransferase [Candidatus Magnetoovum chiemensis]